MSTRWQEYFSREGKQYNSQLEQAAAHWSYHQPLYYQVRKLVKPPARILDIGCGLGYSAIYLQQCGYQVTGLDNDDKILAQAREQGMYFRCEARFEKAEARDLSRYYSRYDLAYSVGVIEHFTRQETVALLKEQAKCAPIVMAVVPSSFTRYAGQITDERIYSAGQMKKILAAAGLAVTGTFGFGDVYAPQHVWVKRLLPYGLYRLLQDNFSYAMDLGCIGRK